MPPVGFEPTISASEWPQTYALDHAIKGTGLRVDMADRNSFPEAHTQSADLGV